MFRQEQAPKIGKADGPWLVSDAHPAVLLEPGEGAWLPVRRSDAKAKQAGRRLDDAQTHYVVMPLASNDIEPVPGTWGEQTDYGIILVTNLGQEDKEIQFGAPVAGLHTAAIQTRVCGACGTQDHDAMLCAEMTKDEPAWCPIPCEVCGEAVTTCAAWIREDEHAPAPGVAASTTCAPAPGQQSVETTTLALIEKRSDHASYHIVEEPGAIDWRNEIQVPTEEYYDKLREDMKARLGASEHGLDHVISVEALLDLAILSGFSFGIEKAKIMAMQGELLGDHVGRKGRWPKQDRIQAILDFPAILNKQQLQQFLGCTNWVRAYMEKTYPALVKMLAKILEGRRSLPSRRPRSRGQAG